MKQRPELNPKIFKRMQKLESPWIIRLPQNVLENADQISGISVHRGAWYFGKNITKYKIDWSDQPPYTDHFLKYIPSCTTEQKHATTTYIAFMMIIQMFLSSLLHLTPLSITDLTWNKDLKVKISYGRKWSYFFFNLLQSVFRARCNP